MCSWMIYWFICSYHPRTHYYMVTLVLSVFRSLHRTRKAVFKGDNQVLTAGRHKINEEFKKNAHETDPVRVNEICVTAQEPYLYISFIGHEKGAFHALVTLAENSQKVLKTTVIQGKLRQDGVYEVTLTKDTALEENTIFDVNADLPVRGKTKKCSDAPESKG